MKPERVRLSKGVANILIDAAIQGYEARYKEERLGILLGNLQNNVAVVKYAKVYRGGIRSRTRADVNTERFTKRVQELCRKHESGFLGTFHTHNEVAGTISSAMSNADRDHLCSEPPHMVELIVAVWRSDSPSRQSQRYFQGDFDGYRFRIAGYQMCSPYRLIPIFSDDVG